MILAKKEKKRLGDILVEQGVISEDILAEILAEQKLSGELFGDILISKNYATEADIIAAIQTQQDIEKVTITDKRLPENAIRTMANDVAFMKKNQCIPYELNGSELTIAMANPLNTNVIDDIRIKTGLRINTVIAASSEIMSALDKYYGSEAISELLTEFTEDDFVFDISKEVDDKSADAPMIKLVNTIFEQAIHAGSSDIHIEPLEDSVRVRYRVDGDLVEQPNKYPRHFLQGIVSRLKIMGNMDISEKRKPQDGRITVTVDNVEFDVRVSMLPTVYGEKTVMRLTNKDKLTMDKSRLGLYPDDEEKFDGLLQNPNGIILVTGPTGSGKSTTLYTALSELNKEKVNISTIEDPVEANIRGINQVAVNVKAGVTFPSALRCFLRQDPDIIMVGEIRDTETASLAVDAALTGHLVVSTLHTNSSVSSISRLEKMGIEPYLLADSVVGILAQRLVKRLCTCKKERPLTSRDRKKLGLKPNETMKIYEPCGCEYCRNTGYKGRIAVYEILVLTDTIKDMIADERPISEIHAEAMKEGLHTLKMSTIRRIREGVTTIEELDRIVHEPDNDEDKEVKEAELINEKVMADALETIMESPIQTSNLPPTENIRSDEQMVKEPHFKAASRNTQSVQNTEYYQEPLYGQPISDCSSVAKLLMERQVPKHTKSYYVQGMMSNMREELNANARTTAGSI